MHMYAGTKSPFILEDNKERCVWVEKLFNLLSLRFASNCFGCTYSTLPNLLVGNDFDHLLKRSMFKLFSFLIFIQGANVHVFYKFALIFIHGW